MCEDNLVFGKSTGCGCRRIPPRTHGLSNAPEYHIWGSMRQRCDNPNNKRFSDYGGRGIKYSDDWKHFERFYEDMGPRPSSQHSLERLDNNGNYTAVNCKWATAIEQNHNRRLKRIEHFGDKEFFSELERRTSAELARRNGTPWRQSSTRAA